MAAPRIRVLVVDDSAFARKVIREVLERSPQVEVVGIARDGLDALEQIANLKPDVITLDLVMPNLDGLGVLEALPPGGPRVVVVSVADEESEIAAAARRTGAVIAVRKPTPLATDALYSVAGDLLDAVLTAARAAPPREAGASRPSATAGGGRSPRVVVIGASTGGPFALTRILAALPREVPVPIAIALHMPLGFTETFARRLDADCAIDVVEAFDGLALRPGLAVVARAGMHLKLRRRGEACVAALDVSPLDKLHHPSVDVLFESAAQAWGRDVLGIVLTGMGDDGLEGARALCAAGGTVITEAESTCTVYGMPRAVAEAGLSSAELRVEAIAGAILSGSDPSGG